MEEIRLSPDDLKELISKKDILGYGAFGIVIPYHDRLIKLDKYLYYLIKNNRLISSNKIIEDYYQRNIRNFQDPKQIEYLNMKQKAVIMTKLPLGIVTLKDVDSNLLGTRPGVIIPYHKNYEKLENLSLNDYKKILIILKKLLLAVKELEENKISQEDFVHYGKNWSIDNRNYNILYKDDTPEIIDICGIFVKAGDQFTSARLMYRALSDVFLDYYSLYKIPNPLEKIMITTYDENEELYKGLEKELKKK